MRAFFRKRIFSVPTGLLIAFFWIGMGVITARPEGQSSGVIFGFIVSAEMVALQWLVMERILAVVFLMSMVLEKKMPALKKLSFPLGLTYLCLKAVDYLALSLRLMTSQEFFKEYLRLAGAVPVNQLSMGAVLLVPVLINIFIAYLFYMNKDYFAESVSEVS